MSESNFTPGPWRWWPCKDGSYNSKNDYAQIASGKTHVARVLIGSVTEDDLRLMVVSREMLQVLEFVECVYRKNIAQKGEPSSVLDELQRVIAKARGNHE